MVVESFAFIAIEILKNVSKNAKPLIPIVSVVSRIFFLCENKKMVDIFYFGPTICK